MSRKSKKDSNNFKIINLVQNLRTLKKVWTKKITKFNFKMTPYKLSSSILTIKIAE